MFSEWLQVEKSSFFFFFSVDYDVDVLGMFIFVICDVIVSDGQLMDIVLLVIGINSFNDNFFIFYNNLYIFVVKVNLFFGLFVGVVLVIDNDVGQFGEIIFYYFLI